MLIHTLLKELITIMNYQESLLHKKTNCSQTSLENFTAELKINTKCQTVYHSSDR